MQLGRSWWRRRSAGLGHRIWGLAGDALSRSLGEEAIRDAGLGQRWGRRRWGDGDRRRGAEGRGATGGESRERRSLSMPRMLGRSHHGVAAVRERSGVTGGVEVRVTIFGVVYILCLLDWTEFDIMLFWVPDGLGVVLLYCIFFIFLKIVNISTYHIVLQNAVSPYLYLPDIDTRIRIHAG
jgi:hypothetical protein